MNRLISTEQVSKYHPDKFADQISDAILNYCLTHDPDSRVACECMVKGRTAVLGGEITSKIQGIPYGQIIDRVAAKLGYKIKSITNLISDQSPEINGAVKSKIELCAGDQGVMFGYACNDTPSFLPYAFDLANMIIGRLEYMKKLDNNSPFKGDAKTQVTVNDKNEIEAIVLSVCHQEGVKLADVEQYARQNILYDLPQDKVIFNPAGAWTIGGAEADCGLTGRKIVCDQYGGFCAVGGGAFSGKDPSKMDRSGAYIARAIAVDLLRQFDLKWCEVQLAYAIGRKEPVSIWVNNDKRLDLSGWVSKHYDLTPYGVASHLKLYDVDYERLVRAVIFAA